MLQPHPEVIQWASGFFLTEAFPDNHDTMSQDELLDFIDTHITDEYELYREQDVLRDIHFLADSAVQNRDIMRYRVQTDG